MDLYILDSSEPQIITSVDNDFVPYSIIELPKGCIIADSITGNVYVNKALDSNVVYVIHNEEHIATLPFTAHPSCFSIDEQTGQLYVASTLSGYFWVLR